MNNKQISPIEEKPVTETLRLKRFFRLVQFFAFAAILAPLILILIKPGLFPVVTHPRLLYGLMIGITILSAIFYFFIAPRVKRRAFLYTNNIVWSVFMVGILYTTGGIFSPFTILLIFPIITTAFDLEATAAAIVGLTIVLLLVGLIAYASEFSLPLINIGIFQIGFVGLITFYVYSIIKETLRQKYEKEETKRKYGELIEIDKAKSDFITAASHQIRTPLSQAKWALSSIEDDETMSAQSRDLLNRSINSLNRLTGIVNEMLQIPSLERPEALYKKEPVELGDLLTESIKNFQILAEQKNTLISFEKPEKKIIVSADKEKLRLALENVIDNSIRYSSDGKAEITVGKRGNDALIKISDSGIGIAQEDKDRIFTKFFRGKNALKTEPNETGIGLYIAKNIIEKHFGTITFTSVLGQGATFFITLPISHIQ